MRAGLPRTIAVMNQKGGVGKTTTAVNLSAALARNGCRVCLLDLDPQAHATLHLGVEPQPSEPSLYDVLCGQAALADARRQVAERLFLVGASIDLAGAELQLAARPAKNLILREKLLADNADFDYLLIDCPPSLGLLTINALAAVEEVFIPLQPHFLALHGLSKLLETIELVAQRFNERLRLTGVLLCLYDAGTRLAMEVERDAREFFQRPQQRPAAWASARLFQTRIRRNIRLAEAPSFGQTIFQYAPNSHGAEDYLRLAEEVLRQAMPAPPVPVKQSEQSE